MSYEYKYEYAPGVIKYTNVYFMNKRGKYEDRVFDEVYRYVDKNVVWVPDTDDTFIYNELGW